MLITSHRHTKADLQFWEELEQVDRLNGERLLAFGKIERSLEEIRKFAALNDRLCYAAVSWGRDSVVLADLVCRVSTPIPLVHVKAVPTCNPHSDDVRDNFLATHPVAIYHEILNADDACSLGPEAKESAKTDVFLGAFKRAGFGNWGYMTGIRADESGTRRRRMKCYGSSTKKTLAPLGWWTSSDVFAYLAIRNLPVHPNYAMTGGGLYSRDRIRVSELGGEFGRERGRREWELTYYGDVMRRLRLV